MQEGEVSPERLDEMGLDVTVGELDSPDVVWAFKGAYSAFHRWRGMLLRVLGGWGYGHDDDTDERRNKWRFPEGMDSDTHPGLFCLFNHSDCDGEIEPETAEKLAAELEEMLPLIRERAGVAEGHLASSGGHEEVTRRFIVGCQQSQATGYPMVFW